jgi:dynein heavy chain
LSLTIRVLSLEANDNLCVLKKSYLDELRSFSKPPVVCQLIFEGVGVLFEPSKKKFEWADARKLMNDQFLHKLVGFDVNTVSEDQVSRLTSLLARDECQPDRVAQVSPACHSICLWLRAIVNCANLQRQLVQQQTQ